MNGRTVVTSLGAVAVAVLAFVIGVAVRPALVQDPSAAPSLTVVEVGYLQDMLSHHQQAVTMSQLVDRDGLSTPIRSLARQIVQEQSIEIGTMVGYLQLADEPIQSSTPMAWMHRDVDGSHHADTTAEHPMPGMASADEVASLGTLVGVAAENEFLRLMQRHHYGGIAMTQDLLSYGSAGGPVVRLARSSLTMQTKETGLIGAMLLARGISDGG
ncbi:DUF305 domain-containing protein [Gordonia hydrophobica]|uniref:DUF305 domain-containing protein n=1 Tax=Gordonia hydrophobica TaxID=40516 RepID=A0ABZ2U9X4_9ACTN|nr:DUF305 domain-containing protein [Gordonia hydrophobica]MBM7366164.1 uncharacterized protein (DUF305 family) [Gordonia hydrophobica]